MTAYRVEKDGKTVFEAKSKGYDRSAVPREWWARPQSGEVRVFVDDELVSVTIPISEAEARAIEAQRAADLKEG